MDHRCGVHRRAGGRHRRRHRAGLHGGAHGRHDKTPPKKRSGFSAAAFQANTIQIAGTGALTDGTHSAITDVVGADAVSELAAAATVPKGRMEILKTTDDLDREPIILAANQGLVVRNVQAMGAGGTARVIVEMDWLEVGRS